MLPDRSWCPSKQWLTILSGCLNTATFINQLTSTLFKDVGTVVSKCTVKLSAPKTLFSSTMTVKQQMVESSYSLSICMIRAVIMSLSKTKLISFIIWPSRIFLTPWSTKNLKPLWRSRLISIWPRELHSALFTLTTKLTKAPDTELTFGKASWKIIFKPYTLRRYGSWWLRSVTIDRWSAVISTISWTPSIKRSLSRSGRMKLFTTNGCCLAWPKSSTTWATMMRSCGKW